MRAAVIMEPGRLRVADDVPEPTIGAYEALVRIVCCATCNGTDDKLVKGQLGAGRYPAILGHESVGVVERVGPKVRHLAPGELVLRPSALYPGEQAGVYHSAWGGFAEWGKVTDLKAAVEDGHSETDFNRYCRFQQPVPAMEPADATMLITLKETKSWLNRAGVKAGSALLVIGDGPVAAAFVGLAAAMGAGRIAALGHRESRLAGLAALGATLTLNTTGLDERTTAQKLAQSGADPFDVIVDTVVHPELFEPLRERVAPNARFTVYGTPQPRLSREAIRPYQLTFDEAETHEEVLELVRTGRLQLGAFYGPIIPLDEIDEAIRMVRERDSDRKVVVGIAPKVEVGGTRA